MTAPDSATPANVPGRGAASDAPSRNVRSGPDPTGSGPSGVPHPRSPGDRAPTGPPRPPVPAHLPPPAYPAARPAPAGGYRAPDYACGGGTRPTRTAPGGAPVADLGSRLAAYLLDNLIQLPAMLAVELVAVGLGFVDCQVRHVQTVGRRTLKIKVVSVVDGSPMTRRQAVRRWLVQYPGGAVAPWFSGVDGLWQLGSEPYRQCLHDLCAETVVVRVAGSEPRRASREAQ